MIYNRKRWNGSSDQMSLTEDKNQYYQWFGSVLSTRSGSVCKTLCFSCVVKKVINSFINNGMFYQIGDIS